MLVRACLFVVAFAVTLTGCGWLFDQRPVCPPKHPRCWMEDQAFVHGDGNETPMGAGRDAGADGDTR